MTAVGVALQSLKFSSSTGRRANKNICSCEKFKLPGHRWNRALVGYMFYQSYHVVSFIGFRYKDRMI